MAVQKYTVAFFLAMALVIGPAAIYAADGGYTPAVAAAAGGKATTEEQKLLEDVNTGLKAAEAAAAKVPPADKFKTFEATFYASSKANIAAAAKKAPQLIPQLDEAYNAGYKAAELAAPKDKYEAFILHLTEALRIIAGAKQAGTGYATAAPAVSGGKKATAEEQKLLEDVNAGLKAAKAAAANVPPADKFKTFEAAFYASSKANIAAAAKKAPQLIPQLDEAYNAGYNAAELAAPEDKYEAFVLHLTEALRIIAGTKKTDPAYTTVTPAAAGGKPAGAATPAAIAGGYKV